MFSTYSFFATSDHLVIDSFDPCKQFKNGSVKDEIEVAPLQKRLPLFH